MTVKLSISDRINFASLYPEQGTVLTQMVVKDINSKVSLTTEEMASISLVQEGNTVKWDAKRAEKLERDVDFTDAEVSFLQSRVDEMDKAGRVTLHVVELFNRIRGLAKGKV